MKFSSTLLAVKDMEKSLKFYKEIFKQEVTMDLGWNKTLSCGLVLQSHFDELVGFPDENMKWKGYNMELYFETDDMDEFIAILEKHPEVEKVHDLKTHDWQQRVVRIFDPDGHMIEVGESMEKVAFREFDKGHNLEETQRITQHPMELVKIWHEHYLARK
ncbi:MAG: glyoxalase/bleomycin resistance/dioxygenase family protein [Clostridia bacterium]|nr:glyoxalase/bleomycin resistance/dioxygenase family protein [Clostridia bacterium]